jgi:putative transposase
MPDPNFRHRTVRIQGFDYSQPGAYFITICTWQKDLIFGNIAKGTIHLSKVGEFAGKELEKLSLTFSEIHLDTFVVMPNHVHILITISENDTATSSVKASKTEAFGHPVTGSIPTIVRAYKAAVTRRAALLRDSPVSQVWQRNYYEHVVRTEREKERIYAYIVSNPIQWDFDDENPTGRNKISRA